MELKHTCRSHLHNDDQQTEEGSNSNRRQQQEEAMGAQQPATAGPPVPQSYIGWMCGVYGCRENQTCWATNCWKCKTARPQVSKDRAKKEAEDKAANTRAAQGGLRKLPGKIAAAALGETEVPEGYGGFGGDEEEGDEEEMDPI